MQRTRLSLLQIFEDHRALEDRGFIDFEHRCLAQRRDGDEPLRLVGEIDVNALERHFLFGKRNDGALHVGAQNVAYQG